MSGHPLKLRGYRREDLDALFQLDKRCFAPHFRFSKGSMKRFAEAKCARVVIAEIAGGLAGFCIVHIQRVHGGDVAYVVTLDVASEHRRAGVASNLMAQVEQEAFAAKCTLMFLHVFVGNDVAVRFYERQGYDHIDDAKDFYGRGIDARVYRKELTTAARSGS